MKSLKNFIVIGLIALFVTAMSSCKNDTKAKVKTVDIASGTQKKLNPNATYSKAEFTIEGMTCAMGCAKTIEKKIAGMDGVKSATVDFDKKLAMVEYDNAKVSPALLEETVGKVSDTYKVSNMKSGVKCKETCTTNTKKACCTSSKTEAEKTACMASCKKACCSDKVKV